jgi:hypothetical protein
MNLHRTVRSSAKSVLTIRVIQLPGLAPGDGLDDWLISHELAEYTAIVAKTKAELPNNGKIVARAHTFPDETTFPLWDFLYGKNLLRKTVSATAATGGTGKSSKSIVEALAMTTGRPLLGVAVPKMFSTEQTHDTLATRDDGDAASDPHIDDALLDRIKSEPCGGLSKNKTDNAPKPMLLRVLLINLEDNREAVDKRIAAAMRHYKLTKEDVGGRLFTIAKGELSFKIAVQSRSGVVVRNEAAINGLTAFLIENKIDVLSIDPFIATHSVNENDNTAIRNVIECYDTIAEAANCAVSIWHHTRKANGQDASIDSARGAGAFIDACRSVRVLETMSKTEAKELGLGHAGSYFRSFNGKLNFAPPTDKSDWFQIVSISLGNDVLFGDEVGVVEAWDHPLKGGKAVDLSMDERSEIRRAFAGSEWREDIRADMWAGKAIATALNLSVDDEKMKIKAILSKLILTGVLKRVTRKDNVRRERVYIECA